MTKSDTAPFAYDGLDRVFHEKARLGIATALMTAGNSLPFTELARLCDLTNGNLSRHLQVMQEAGLVEIHKGYEGLRPLTTVTLTPNGREKFIAYLEILERIVRDAANAGRVGSTFAGGKPQPA